MNLKFLTSVLRRLTTAVTTPFNLALIKLRRMLNINVITAKLVGPLTKQMRSILRMRPREKKDYFVLGRIWVYKKLLFAIVLAACAGVLIYFGAFAKQAEPAPVSLQAIRSDVTFDYDDIAVREFSGIANIRAYDGSIVYVGELVGGVCSGTGMLFSRDGVLLYEGAFADNKYNGAGTLYYQDGTVRYQGEFANNLFAGEGREYNARGELLYEGQFQSGMYQGQGKYYGENGLLLLEGAFHQGLAHGQGIRYFPSGAIEYEGDFFEGDFQGTGKLYDAHGKPIYQGSMYAGDINYPALVGTNLQDIFNTIFETPRIYYQEDGNSCYYFEQAGLAVTTDCRVRVYEREREDGNISEGYYFMPEQPVESPIPQPEADGNDELEPFGPSYYPALSEPEVTEEDAPSPPLILPGAGPNPDSIGVAPMSLWPRRRASMGFLRWSTAEPDHDPTVNPEPPAYIPGPSGSTPESSASASEPSPASPDNSQAAVPQPSFPAAPDSYSQPPGSSSSAHVAGPADESFSSSDENNLTKEEKSDVLPGFVERTRELYFEVDKDVWQSESELDRTKVFVKRVIVLKADAPPEDAEEGVDDNAPPSIDDVVAIDSIRQESPHSLQRRALRGRQAEQAVYPRLECQLRHPH